MLFDHTTLTATPAAVKSRARTARKVALAVAGLALTAGVAGAQASVPAFEIRPLAGAYIPTGEHRDFLNNSLLLGAQGSWLLSPSVAITGGAGWTRNEDKFTVSLEKIDLMQADLGLEARAATSMSNRTTFTPFIGVGGAARRYDYRDVAVDAETFFGGYGALGGELAMRNIGIRVEARDYMTQFRPLGTTGERDWRNDVTLSAGLNLRIW